MRIRSLLFSAPVLAALFVPASALAFFDEVASLQQELQVWQVAQAADLSDVVARLDEITGTVFRDVDNDAWYRPEVSFLADARIISGEKDAKGIATGYFRPTRNVTIAEALKMTMEAAKVDRTTCPAVPEHSSARGHWAASYVSCAETMNVRMITGFTNIGLDRPATRAEVISIVVDVYGEKVPPLYASFTDVRNHPYEADIAYAALQGIVTGDKSANGTPTGTFRPNEKVNRAEAAKVVYERIKLDARRELAGAF